MAFECPKEHEGPPNLWLAIAIVYLYLAFLA